MVLTLLTILHVFLQKDIFYVPLGLSFVIGSVRRVTTIENYSLRDGQNWWGLTTSLESGVDRCIHAQ